MGNYIMALDAGTTSNRAILFDRKGQISASVSKEFCQFFPKPGWVEHDADEIWSTLIGCAAEAMSKLNISSSDIHAIGITNQRETTIVWDRYTGTPVCNAIVWQCRRTSEFCDKLKAEGYADFFRERTGLEIDAYFSATKIRWILDSVSGAKEKAEAGELLFGTVDTWLLWKLSNGKLHITDYSNASRTMLFNIHHLTWDEDILKLLEIPKCILPEVRMSSEVYGTTQTIFSGNTEIPLAGVAGDQQCALFGQTCFKPGSAKNTYGTGAFLLMNTGTKPVFSNSGLITTIAWGINNQISYALEGSIFIAGAAIQWLRDNLKLIDTAAESEHLSVKVRDTEDCYFVPAFTGLGAPYWDQYSRGCIIGLTRGTNKSHIVRAALESIAYLSYDVLHAMEQDSGITLKTLRVDGGGSQNNFLMQYQADIINTPVLRPLSSESTALGAAFLAGLSTKFWSGTEELENIWKIEREFLPDMNEVIRIKRLKKWHRAVSSSLGWAKEDP